jgi:NAD(P)H-dependent flavin oxidoreductase YrpB (nitropropane dioxygenase family)
MSAWLGFDPYVAGRFEGQVDVGALAAGQSSALIHAVLPAGEIVRAIAAEAERALERLGVGPTASVS